MGKKKIKKMKKKALKEIKQVLEDMGLEAAEEAAVDAWRISREILLRVIPIYSKTMGRFAQTMVIMFEDEIMDFIDEIDGEDNPDLGSS